jgi:hypothetical protein
MTRLTRTRIPCVLRHAPNFCALLPNGSLLPPSSTTLFELLFAVAKLWVHGVMCSRFVAQSLHTSAPRLPTIELP